MAIRATINSVPKTRVSINKQERETVKVVGINPTNVNQLRNLADVNATKLNDGSSVVYDQASDKFVVEELPRLNGGNF